MDKKTRDRAIKARRIKTAKEKAELSAAYRNRMENYFVACLLEVGPPPAPPSQYDHYRGYRQLRSGHDYNVAVREWFARQHLQTITGPTDGTCYKFSNQYRRWLAIHASKKHELEKENGAG